MKISGIKSKIPTNTEDNKGNIQKEQQEQINKNLSNNLYKANLMNDESILDPLKPFIELEQETPKTHQKKYLEQ